MTSFPPSLSLTKERNKGPNKHNQTMEIKDSHPQYSKETMKSDTTTSITLSNPCQSGSERKKVLEQCQNELKELFSRSMEGYRMRVEELKKNSNGQGGGISSKAVGGGVELEEILLDHVMGKLSSIFSQFLSWQRANMLKKYMPMLEDNLNFDEKDTVFANHKRPSSLETDNEFVQQQEQVKDTAFTNHKKASGLETDNQYIQEQVKDTVFPNHKRPISLEGDNQFIQEQVKRIKLSDPLATQAQPSLLQPGQYQWQPKLQQSTTQSQPASLSSHQQVQKSLYHLPQQQVLLQLQLNHQLLSSYHRQWFQKPQSYQSSLNQTQPQPSSFISQPLTLKTPPTIPAPQPSPGLSHQTHIIPLPPVTMSQTPQQILQQQLHLQLRQATKSTPPEVTAPKQLQKPESLYSQTESTTFETPEILQLVPESQPGPQTRSKSKSLKSQQEARQQVESQTESHQELLSVSQLQQLRGPQPGEYELAPAPESESQPDPPKTKTSDEIVVFLQKSQSTRSEEGADLPTNVSITPPDQLHTQAKRCEVIEGQSFALKPQDSPPVARIRGLVLWRKWSWQLCNIFKRATIFLPLNLLR
eukprot:TRINITY_DN6313_c0_g2_i9.p1 TRINITY_DN6313_c0_g2~~TRINITY_DN6313_c0_g2_i9.p1  ORF type:complete len:586 (+),score=127.33 TRINITY_DN6313_c0_g2_i9:932-2689(+)